MAGAKSFRELKVYQAAREAAKRVFAVSKRFPREERYSLTDQIRKSSRAVKAMIAEAWARRRYKAAFVNKIDEALGEANETQSWLDDALDCRYLSAADFQDLDNRYQAIGGMLSRMIDRADSFCKYAPATDYRTISRVEEEFYSPITDHHSRPETDVPTRLCPAKRKSRDTSQQSRFKK
jgi:four helix bundle protein